MKWLLVLAAIAAPAQTVQTVTIQANPIPMATFGKISGLSDKTNGLWHITARNDSSSAVTLDFVDVQQCFPEVDFLTLDETQIILSRDQQFSRGSVALDIGADAELAAAAFLGPLALTLQPIYQLARRQVQSRVPNESKLLAVIAKTASQSIPPGGRAVSTMLAGKVHGAHEQRCVLQVKSAAPVQPTLMVPYIQSKLEDKLVDPIEVRLDNRTDGMTWIKDQLLAVRTIPKVGYMETMY